ncbi:MAG: efflux RND transporter permease subunit [Candidatus Moranbacteria bacterium]|nr:efflux RND transporter permease subunit [Candidatus Moranbacteria bacterium]
MNDTHRPLPDDTAKHGTSSDSRYLSRLSFDPSLRTGLLNFFVTHTRVILLMMGILSAWGIYAFLALPRESEPEVKIPIAVVTTAYPGASPGDVEELVTKKIETELAALKGVTDLTSTSANSVSSVVIEFDAKENLDDAIRRVRDAAESVKNDLPEDAEDPVVREISLDDRPIFTVALSGASDGFVLREEADDLADTLEKIPGVREVSVSGGDTREFSVAYDPSRLAALGISASSANRAIAAANVAIPAGSQDGDTFSYPVRADGRVFTAAALRDLPIGTSASGTPVRLSDVARVEETAIERTSLSRLSVGGSEPADAVTLSLVKKTGGSIIDISDQAQQTVRDAAATLPSGVRAEVMLDHADYIREDFDHLRRDFLITLGLVMATLFLIVGLKEAVIAGLAIPLVFFATFGIMLLSGTSLNFLSLFSLLLSLGLLVDDAIVVVSATKQYLRTGKFTPEEAVLLVLRDFKVVLLSTTLATTFAFLPLLLSTGIMGEYIKSIPITVSVTLLSSLAIALAINHPLAAALERIRLTRGFFAILFLSAIALAAFSLLRLHGLAGFLSSSIAGSAALSLVLWRRNGGKETLLRNESQVELERTDDEAIRRKLRHQGSEDDGFLSRLIHGIIRFDAVIPVYERTLRFVLSTRKRRVLTVVSAVALLVLSALLPVTGIVKSEFFPASDSETLTVSVTGPSGLTLERTDAIVRSAEKHLRTYPEIESFSTVVGSGSASHEATISLELVPAEERNIASYDLATKIREELPRIDEADITVEAPRSGPPAGAAFEAHIEGDDLSELSRLAERLKGILSDVPGTVGEEISLKEAPAEFTFALDHARLAAAGLDATTVGSTLRMAVSGTTVSTVLRNGEETDIVARFDTAAMPDLTAVENLRIVTASGKPVFLRDMAKIELRPSVNAVEHTDQKRTVTVSSDVEGAANPQEIQKEFERRLAEAGGLPDGYTVSYGGENEQNAESVQSILRAMVVAGILILATLVIQFNSFRSAFIVLITLPLALIGVFPGLAILRVPLSFPGLIGILALFGIVVKNAIILVDKIKLNEKSGIPFEEAIVDAGKSRLEAIFITSICTILGIIPITLSDEVWQGLGSVIIFGLMLSSFLTLFIVPLLYRMLAPRREREAADAS